MEQKQLGPPMCTLRKMEMAWSAYVYTAWDGNG